MGHYMRNEDALVPPAGRFNFGQKQFFWLMVICAAALLVSGLVLWFTSSIPRELQAVRYLAVLIHAIAALATIGGIIIHIYMGVAVVPDGLHAILHGEVSEQWARHHHGLWAPKAPRIRTSGSHAERDGSVDLGR
jgi:formate dehydrogenase subunit gamma